MIGCGLTFLETSANPYVTELGARQTAAARLNMAQSFNGLGAMCAPIVGGWLIFRDNASVALPYMGLGIFVLLAAVVFTRVRLPEIHEDDSAAGSAEKQETYRWHATLRLYSACSHCSATRFRKSPSTVSS